MSKRAQRREKQRLKRVQTEQKSPKKEQTVDVKPKEHRNFFQRVYEDHYKILFIIPMALLLLALVQIGVQTAITGDFIQKDVSLKGGLTITIPEGIDTDTLTASLERAYPDAAISVRGISTLGETVGVVVEADVTHEQRDDFVGIVAATTGVEREDLSVEEIGSSLGQSFFHQTMIALLIAFLFMGIVVFLYFKTFVPSTAVILAAFSDIVITVAIVNVLGIKISTAGIAAFLMLIGYSVDTDILLSTRVLKRTEGTLTQRIYDALKTGLTMNMTTLAAVTIGMVVAKSDTLAQIMTILFIGLLVDMINTWIQNVGILRWYVERKNVKD